MNLSNALLEIRETKGLKAKQKLLKFFGDNNKLFLKLLVLAYDPYHKFGSYENAETELIAQGIELDQGDIHLVFKKNLKLGVGAKSINQVFPNLILQHDVMLAKPFDESRANYPLIASPKLDGLRGIYYKGKLYTRNGHEIRGVSRLVSTLKSLNQSYGFTFDGELIIPGEEFNTTSGLIRALKEVDTVVFNLIDIPDLPQKHWPFKRRYQVMKRIGQISPFVQAIPHRLIKDDMQLAEYYVQARELGYEGLVVKPIDYEYVRRRSYAWMKIKPEETLDLTVLDVYEGQGLFTGMLGGVLVDYKGVKVKVGSGFSQAERELFWADPNIIVGQVIEVSYMEETPYGSLRFPIYKGIRHDKS